MGLPLRIQYAKGGVTTGAITLALGAAPTPYSVLVLYVGLDSNTVSSTVAQTNATWTNEIRFQDATSGLTIEEWRCLVGPATNLSTSIVVTPSSNLFALAMVLEYPGLAQSSPLDVSKTNGVASPSTTIDSGLTTTPNQALELHLVAVMQHQLFGPSGGGGANTLVTPSGGYALVDQISRQAGTNIVTWRNLGVMEKYVTTVEQGGCTCTTASPGSTSQSYATIAACLKGAIRPGTIPAPQVPLFQVPLPTQ